mmetsp:Transcript_20831/g.57925  ORF Transcript_20831/g.57925 Transcript_20831/m.57925 type:complete len:364 (-) Transcript_20831:191-1282(-)|eukprot:CAMPEP_0198111046 /NCGR_PEP_ID=MMETSP1442-20131203/3023_1 /TAXON_ID= /ORGANISM="Craspedostauros australis, Strain CCMP3328" /LENGTH=363 /DNA_ID=CAMNT_0043767327 /DNA_START=162 /DNA_END=1253 /DNA_ORIENTATION=+
MPLKIPAGLKKITPFVRRAEELDKDKASPESRIVAFYCRQYAVRTGIPLANGLEGKQCLGEIMGDLEKEKAAMSSFTPEEAKLLCRKFADKVFEKADAEDRAGQSTKNTAKTFYAAASFLEMLQQFHSEGEDAEEKEEEKKRIKYAKWKATDTIKALNEGRQPTSGGYGESAMEDDEDEGEATPAEAADEKPESAESAPSQSTGSHIVVETVKEDSILDEEEEYEQLSIPPPEEPEEPEESGTEVELCPPPAYTAPAPARSASNSAKPPLTFSPIEPLPPPPMPKRKPKPSGPSAKPKMPKEAAKPKKSGGVQGFGKKKKGKVSKAEIADATELTRFALAALEDKDTDLAAERLQQALQSLGR